MQPKFLAHSPRRKTKTISIPDIKERTFQGIEEKHACIKNNTKDLKSNTEQS
jgi:hypothetical protein